jgi:hypothetical protein
MTFDYFNIVPNAPNDPADDQPKMLQNTQAISGLIAVDHIGFNLINGGTHTVVHLKNNAGNAAPLIGFGELYAQTISSIISDTALYYQTGSGLNIQMTVNGLPNPVSNTAGPPIQNRGWTFLPGGIIMNYGNIVDCPVSPANQAVVYLQPYQVAAPYMLTFGYSVSGSITTYSVWLDNPGSNTKLGFNIKTTAPIHNVIYWCAIGQ